MPLTPDQRRAVEFEGRPLFIQAGAGTGKTFTLKKRLAHGLSGKPEPFIRGIDNVLVITFTEKAAAELLGRVRAELREQGLDEEALQIDAAWISTIHSMCKRILAAHALEAGIDPGIEQLGEDETGMLLEIALDQVLEAHSADRRLGELQKSYKVDDLCSLLRDLAKRIATNPGGREGFDLGPEPKEEPARALRVLVESLEYAWGGFQEIEDPGKPTFTKLGQLLEAELEAARGLVVSGGSPSTWTEALAVLCAFGIMNPGNLKVVKELFCELRESMYDNLAMAMAAAARETLSMLLDLAQEVCDLHSRLKTAMGALDMDDLLIRSRRLLVEHPEVASMYEERFDSVMVDEFQDTDRMQVDIISRLCDEKLSSLVTVGDEQQSIYGFRGTDLEVFRGMRRRMRQAGGEEVGLKVNYRSHPDVLTCVEDIFSQRDAFGDAFFGISAGPDNVRELEWLDADAPRINVLLAAGRKVQDKAPSADMLYAQEAEMVAEEFRNLAADGASYGDMAILMRGTNNVDPYLQALRRRDIPCAMSGGSTFYTLPEVRYLVDFLRVLENRDDDLALLELLSSPFFSLDDDELIALSAIKRRELSVQPGDMRDLVSLSDALDHRVAELPDDPHEQAVVARGVLHRARCRLGGMPLERIVRNAVRESGWERTLGGQGVRGLAVVANIERFCDIVSGFEQKYGPSLGRVTAQMRALVEEDSGVKGAPGRMVSKRGDNVQIMTIHASKGLEFPIVAVVGYHKERARAGGRLRMLSEGDRATLSLMPPWPSGASVKSPDVMKHIATHAQSEDSFDNAHTPVDFMAHGIELEQVRDYEEEQRILYVALTRAREVLYIVMHDGCFLDQPDKEFKHLNGLIMRGLFPQGTPQVNAVTELSSGGKVSLRIKEVLGQDLGGDEGEEGVRLPAALHAIEPSTLRPSLEAYVPIEPLIYSYSSITHRDEEPADRDHLIPKREEPDAGTVSRFGSAFHLVAQWLACIDAADDEMLADRIEAAARRYRLDGTENRRLGEAVHNWIASERNAQAYRYPVRHAEYPFCVRVADTSLEGYIDLLCLDGKARDALIIDYKTGTSGMGDAAELRRRYRLQAVCYAFAVLTGGICSHVELAFVRPEVGLEEVTFEFDANDVDDLEREILDR